MTTSGTPKEDKPKSFTVGSHPADMQEISVATMFGACSGFAVKKIAKGAGFAIGLGFMSLQALSYSGVIKINWDDINKKITGGLDADGDGKLTANDFKVMGARLVQNLSTDLPSAGGFGAAFFLGWRYG
ncbi:hypothetical protein HDU98_001159 [Podochytrium sp. JEL0797]|nr:hypothetical protein HDU98_001159 [Podochytrium sp. JEL0797]